MCVSFCSSTNLRGHKLTVLFHFHVRYFQNRRIELNALWHACVFFKFFNFVYRLTKKSRPHKHTNIATPPTIIILSHTRVTTNIGIHTNIWQQPFQSSSTLTSPINNIYMWVNETCKLDRVSPKGTPSEPPLRFQLVNRMTINNSQLACVVRRGDTTSLFLPPNSRNKTKPTNK